VADNLVSIESIVGAHGRRLRNVNLQSLPWHGLIQDNVLQMELLPSAGKTDNLI
jgi:hypothetical protein